MSASEPPQSPGTLYVVATPIGNLADLTMRAADVLRQVPLIAAESTRRADVLLRHIGAQSTLTEYSDRSGPGTRQRLLQHLRTGSDLALISAAGTPLISDPGHRLVGEALAAGIEVVPVPGVSAVVAALSVSHLATDRFAFEGFPPRAGQKRRDWLAQLAEEVRTMVVYETAERLPKLLVELCDTLGADRPAVLAQEMTKLHERFVRDSLSGLLRRLEDGGLQLMGEAVLQVAGSEKQPMQKHADVVRILQAFAELCPPAEAARRTAALTGVSRRELYRLIQASEGD